MRILFFTFVLSVTPTLLSLAQPPPSDSLGFSQVLRPLLDQHCFSCHNVGKVAGGINLEKYEDVGQLVEDGHIWLQVVQQIEAGQMPPDTKPALTLHERDALAEGIGRILRNSLKEKNPGRVVIHRLNHTEYRYTILDLIGVDFDAPHYFPSDGSGGAGFDNFAQTLFVTPLKLERYYAAAETIIEQAYQQPDLWRTLVPYHYQPGWWEVSQQWWQQLTDEHYDPLAAPTQVAEQIVYPFASRAYRRYLTPGEKQQLMSLFRQVYAHTGEPEAFDQAIQETMKAVLVSPHFLYRVEDEQPTDTPYSLSGFELASRLSYFLWSSLPDQPLFEAAYRGNLRDSSVLAAQVKRMLRDPKARRFSESFAAQWFGIAGLREVSPVDETRFPTFTPSLRDAMYQESIEFFHYVLTERRDLRDLLDSDYTFVNEALARHYGIKGVRGSQLRRVALADRRRGGVLGMGSVLASTSLPLRTSPVKRGKWVLEELLGTPPPPPPPDAGELPAEKANATNASLRDLLAEHRRQPSCRDCHVKMDPIGLGLENYDAIGRWRPNYGSQPIVVWDTLAGEVFRSALQLKEIIRAKEENFARTVAERMFTYAIGRSVEFVDEPTMERLVATLQQNNFDPETLIISLVTSYPFRYKMNDFEKKLSNL